MVPRLTSGAGHDAMEMAGAGPAGMLFVRCGNGGISHSPLETVGTTPLLASLALSLGSPLFHGGPTMLAGGGLAMLAGGAPATETANLN